MSHRRPPARDEAMATAGALRALAQRIETSGPAMAVIADALTIGYPSSGSTAPTQPANKVDEDGHPLPSDTLPEALAIVGPDPAFNEAQTLVADLRRIGLTALRIHRGIDAHDPNRSIVKCPRCQHPLQPGLTRCNRMIDGTRCGTCRDCGKVMDRGEHLRDGRCNKCRMTHTRTEAAATTPPRSERIASVDRIQLQANVIEEAKP